MSRMQLISLRLTARGKKDFLDLVQERIPTSDFFVHTITRNILELMEENKDDTEFIKSIWEDTKNAPDACRIRALRMLLERGQFKDGDEKSATHLNTYVRETVQPNFRNTKSR